MSVAYAPTAGRSVYDEFRAVLALGTNAVQAPTDTRARYDGMRLRAFITDVLGESLWSKQEDICDAVDDHRFVAVRSCHSAGKSHVASRIALAYLHVHPGSIVVTTAPTNRQVKNILWRYINAAAIQAGDRLLGRAKTMEYEISPDWYAIGLKGSDDNPDAFQGFHAENLLLIVDEAAGVSEKIFEVIESILTGQGASCLLIGNPTSMSGTFRDAFGRNRDLWHGIKIAAADTPNFTGEADNPRLIDAAWVERQLRRHGEDSPWVQSRVHAEFPEEGGNTLITISHVEAMAARLAGGPGDDADVHWAERDRWQVGVDVARFGDDESAMTIRRGPAYFGTWAWSKQSTTESVGNIARILAEQGIAREDADVYVDVIGVGGGVADQLREQGYRVVDVNVGARSSDREQWPNLRHELWEQLAARFRDGRIGTAPGIEVDEVAASQLTDIKYGYRSGYTGRMVESKDDARRRGVSSPDRAESLMLAYASLPPNTDGPVGIVMTGRARARW